MLCKNCNNKDAIKYSKYSNGEFCCKTCACSYSTKEKKTEINKIKSDKMKLKWKFDSDYKEKQKLYIHPKYTTERKLIQSEIIKAFWDSHPEQKRKYSIRRLGAKATIETKHKLSIIMKNRCSDIDERHRLREIGRLGGFGKKGFTKNKNRYESILEKECIEYIEDKNINFIPHKIIPNSSKVCDIYLSDVDLYIELDGINREKKKKYKSFEKNYYYWYEKLRIYEKNNINYIIFLSKEEFIEFIENMV